MTIRWRLSVFFLQAFLLLTATKFVTGEWLVNEIWFISGLLALVINPQLLEPFYPRPIDVLVNSLVGLLLYYFAGKTVAGFGWTSFAILCLITTIISLVAIIWGRKREVSNTSQIARACTILSRYATSLVIYSTVFWLALIDFRPTLDNLFWTLGLTWAIVVTIGSINWQSIWSTMSGQPLPCKVEGMVGPSVLMISSSQIPAPGTYVSLIESNLSTDAIVLARIHRSSDIWAQVHVQDQPAAQKILRLGFVSLKVKDSGTNRLIGSVQHDSTVTNLRFLATRDHQIGDVVAVPAQGDEVLYQISSAKIISSNVKGGSHLVVETNATQLGIFRKNEMRMRRYRWVPSPGAPVLNITGAEPIAELPNPNASVRLGCLIGTKVPVFLNIDSLREGHLAILGMTRMGKTTLAARFINVLGALYRVTVLDQTGEYVSKRGYTPYNQADDTRQTGVSVLEVPRRAVAADEALKYLERLMTIAEGEYRAGTPTQRVILIDEAHQFIPEPAGLGFGAPGRDNAYKFGVLMMQVRKFGICVILISQRTAVVAKSALSQCENLIAFKSVDQTGLEYLEQVLGEGARPLLPLLNQGEALAFGPAISADSTVGITIDQN